MVSGLSLGQSHPRSGHSLYLPARTTQPSGRHGRVWHCPAGLCVPEGSALTLFPVFQSTPSPSADLLGLGAVPPAPAGPPSSGGLLVDVFSDSPSAVAPLAPGSEDNFAR